MNTKNYVVVLAEPDDDEVYSRIQQMDCGPDDIYLLDENTSDGFHTFKELYEHRMMLTATLFNCWQMMGNVFNVHKSEFHHDGSRPFGGEWFIVVAQLPMGQISYHYEWKYWDLFNIPIAVKAAEYDGHTSQDVIERLKGIL